MASNKLTAAIITMSDSRAAGSGAGDKSGTVIRELLEAAGYTIIFYDLIADDFVLIQEKLIQVCNLGAHLVITSGGTGLSPRDNTPEATKAVIEKEVPGISEAMRMYSLAVTDRAMLSRGVSGIRGQSLIVNLPGSAKAARENLSYVLPTLRHGIEILVESTGDCAGVNGLS